MSYIQFILELPKSSIEISEDLLLELGALAVTLEDAKDDPLFEPNIGTTPLWQNIKMIALFDDESDLEPIKKVLKENLSEPVFASLQIEKVEEKDWVRASLEQFKPQCFGERLWICPSWCHLDVDELKKADAEQQEPIIVLLNPGLAFGTGTHPTTQLCLQWLATHSVKDKFVVDYGCGSGILGIAALKLGAKQLIAVDYDPQAILSTEENAKLNAITAPTLNCISPLEEVAPIKVDLILANILANPLIELAPKLVSMLAAKGEMVLSGILAPQAEQVIEAYQPYMQNFMIEYAGDWVSIYAERKAI